MCGIIGILLANQNEFVNQMLFDGLTVLQHRGQDAAGMVTAERTRLHLRKDNGLVKDVFHQHHMLELRGHVGIGHVRYPTAGSSSCAEAQPLYTNHPYGICVAHNGNLTNAEALTHHMCRVMKRHVNTDSDSEVLLNLFAEHLTAQTRRISSTPAALATIAAAAAAAALPKKLNGGSNGSGGNNNHHSSQPPVPNYNDDDEDPIDMTEAIFTAISAVMQQARGGYAGLYLINGFGLVGFRDPNGIRPLVFGKRERIQESDGSKKFDYVLCSESVAIDTLGFQLERDIYPGEAVFIDMQGNCHQRACYPEGETTFSPCIFEYVYFARPDSIMDGVSVYETRMKMGEKLAAAILEKYPQHEIDVVIPIPDTSRTSALQAAYILNVPFREGFIKNRYIARTFIMPGQATRKKSVRLKLNTIKAEFAGKNVLLVDDSIVRGTTAYEIVQMAREAGARKVFFSSAAPPIRYPNIYGIDIPTREELIAFGRDEAEIAQKIGCDWVIYQKLVDLEDAVKESKTLFPNKPLQNFDTSCFSGIYVTGEQIGDAYFGRLHDLRNDQAKQKRNQHGSTTSISEAASNGNSSHGSRYSVATDMEAAILRDFPPQQSNDGCESVSNDKREDWIGQAGGDGACESLTNQPLH